MATDCWWRGGGKCEDDERSGETIFMRARERVGGGGGGGLGGNPLCVGSWALLQF